MAYNPNKYFGDTYPVGGAGEIPTFGMSPCMLDLTLAALRLLPGNLLALITLRANAGAALAMSKLAQIKAEILEWLGLKEDEVDGQRLYDLSPGYGGVANFIAEALFAYNFIKTFIDQIAATYDMIAEVVDAIKECLDGFEDGVNAEQGNNGEVGAPITPDTALRNVYEQQVASINDYLVKTQNLLNNISIVLEEREKGISLDPYDIIAGLSGTGDLETDNEIFRLTYGPPKSTVGEFVLSVDGLYYDSQGRVYEDGTNIPGVDDLKFIPDADRWKLDHSPNLGGKGTSVTLKDLNNYLDTLLDIEIIDDSLVLREYYEQDHLLQTLDGHKNLTIGKLQETKNALVADYGEESALAINIQQQIFSEIELYDIKIRKRKKQIELAVKAPDLFGLSSMFAPGDVPVNNFGYLAKVNLSIALEKQRDLIIDEGDVSGVILPLKPVFVSNQTSRNSAILAPILVQPDITGGLADNGSRYAEGLLDQDSPAPVLTLTDPIHLSGLIASYNFLDNEVVQNGSTEFLVRNCTGDRDQNAQLVGPSAERAFPDGLGIPKLTGIVRYERNTKANFNTYAKPSDEVGTYVRLPDSEKMQNIFYNPSGAAFDMWIHTPSIVSGNNRWELGGKTDDTLLNLNSDDCSWLDSNYYRLLVANENTGAAKEGSYINQVNNFSTGVVRGFVMGFTRDPIFTFPASNNHETTDAYANTFATAAQTVNDPSKTCLFLAPTQSFADKGCHFIKADDCNPESAAFRSLAINLNVTNGNGETLYSAKDGFAHLNVSFDYTNDLIYIYLNGSKLVSGLVNGVEVANSKFKISEIFGTKVNKPINLPTFKLKTDSSESFQYSTAVSNRYGLGPKNDEFFTPWIIGGGWTDGIPTSYQKDGDGQPIVDSFEGGFMGKTSGIYSGFGGYIGSFKIYSNPLEQEAVQKNYNAHRLFFTNIDLG